MNKFSYRLCLTLLIFIDVLIFTSSCVGQNQSASDISKTTPKPEVEEDKTPPVKHPTTNYVEVKYRATQVNLAALGFEYHNTDKSSFIRGAW